MEPPLGTQQGAMQPLVADSFEACLLNKVDWRRQRVSQMVEEVQKVVYQLTTEISNQDIRFQAIPYSPMYNGNITVLGPSQFLVTVPVRGLAGYREAREQRWRYYTLQGARLHCPLRSPEGLLQWLEVQQFAKNLWQWHETDVSIEGDIVPAKVLQVFRKLVENAIETCHLSGKVSMLTSGIAVHVAMETSAGQVEIELAPEVEIPTAWSKRAPWPRCLSRWPSAERAKCIKSFGFSLLARWRWHYHWQLSFLQAERVLLEQLDEDGGCRRRCLQALRQLKEDVWCPGRRPVITSHHLQTVLFWTCEKYPHARDWRVFSKGLLRLARKLHKCVRQRFLKHFFVRSGNLLEHATAAELDAVAQRLGLFLKDPGGLLTLPSGRISADGSSQVPDSCPGERHQAAMGITLTTGTSEA
ncbi:protein mab-21-like 3 isoform X2 [Pipistrellus kuhlii]|uniref:Mab-21 like 3 n=1 Tax=Pipistrellus kuhlii TaxID=59472 RepID=A0A7J7TW76_PIPKU|nr:protein mab-21-like 3 isoform X2 [Pipistrellus kuhlii]KAF6304842.1 mab-21 like 3 [Pipistrellus kuhlii]